MYFSGLQQPSTENVNPIKDMSAKLSLKSDSENSSSDENVSLIALATKSKKQRLILSDGEENEWDQNKEYFILNFNFF